MGIDFYDLDNAIRQCKDHTDQAKRDTEFYIDDKVRDLQSSISYQERQIDGLKSQMRDILEQLGELQYQPDTSRLPLSE